MPSFSAALPISLASTRQPPPPGPELIRKRFLVVVHVGRDQLVEVLEKAAQAVLARDSLGYLPRSDAICLAASWRSSVPLSVGP